MKNIYFITYRTSEIIGLKKILINKFFKDVTIFEDIHSSGIILKNNEQISTNSSIVYFEPLKDDFDYLKSIDYIKIWQDLFARLKKEYTINIIIINDTLTFGPWQGYEILCSCCLQNVKYLYITTDNLLELVSNYTAKDDSAVSLSINDIDSFFENKKFTKLKL